MSPASSTPRWPDAMAKVLIIAGVVLIAVGLAWLVGEKLGLGRLPGDIVIERGNTRVYFPITTSILISIVLSLALWLFSR
jgi:hypothetical protein